MLTDKELIYSIDETIASIWKEKIKCDYDSGWLLKEDTLKNALYYHLRRELGSLFEQNDIRIFTEFTDDVFKKSGYRPDMVIARVSVDSEDDYWGNAVSKCLAVIEIKYKTGFAAHKEVYKDYSKLYDYVEMLGTDTRLYMATIWEYEDDETKWVEDTDWVKGRVIELNASYIPNSEREMRFYICSH